MYNLKSLTIGSIHESRKKNQGKKDKSKKTKAKNLTFLIIIGI